MQNNTVTALLTIFVNGVDKGTHILPSPIQGRTITHEYQSTKDGGASMITSNLPNELLNQLQQVFNQYFADATAKEKSVTEKVSEHLERLTTLQDKQIEFLNSQRKKDKITDTESTTFDRTGFLTKWIREVDELKAELQYIQAAHELPGPGFAGSILFDQCDASRALLKEQLKRIEELFFTATHLYHKLTHSHINIRLVYATKDQWIFLQKVKALRDIMLYVRANRTASYWSDDVNQFKLFLNHKF